MSKTAVDKETKALLRNSIIVGSLSFIALLVLTSAAEYEGCSVFDLFSGTSASDVLRWLNPVNVIQNITGTGFLISMFVGLMICALLMANYFRNKNNKHDMAGVEQGSAKWLINVNEEEKKGGKKYKEPASAKAYREEMMSPTYTDNIMFDNKYGLSTNVHKTLRNLHMLVLGGSGSGKTRFFIKPNILQMNSSYIITDPSGELYRDMGQMLKDNNYDVRVFNTQEPNKSMQYNPLSYINDDEDAMKLVTALIKNTGEATGDNKFFDDATKQLLLAIILFLFHYCPKSEHDFAHVMRLVTAADVPEGQKNPQSDLDKIFEQVKVIDPNGTAYKTYKSFKSTAGKTLKSVLSSTATRLTVFNLPKIERLTCADTISLSTIGDEKTAVFIVTPPTDNGFNFLVAMMYTQLFSTLYHHATYECKYLLTDNDYIARPFESKERAEYVMELLTKQKESPGEKLIRYEYDDMTEKYTMYDESDGKILLKDVRDETKVRFENTPEQFCVKQNTKAEAGIPIHTRMLMDEFANINEIPDFNEVLATIRKYNVSIVIVLQDLSQLKKRYEKDNEAIVANCDTFVFLGTGAGAQASLETVSKMLGDQTITVRNSGTSTGGKSKSSSYNYSQTKRALLTPDELGKLPTDEQVIILRAKDPFRLKKFKLEKHPNFDLCADGKGKQLDINHLDLERKISEYNKKHGIEEIDEDNQEEINKKSQQSVSGWMASDFSSGGSSNSSKNEGTDEFFF